MNRDGYAAQIHSAANALGMSGEDYGKVADLLRHIADSLDAEDAESDAEQDTETG